MKKIMVIFALVVLMGCNTSIPMDAGPGKFAVEKVSGLSKTVYAPMSGGDMYGADVTYFFLKNVGNTIITDISLEVIGVEKKNGEVYEAVSMPDAFTVNPGTLYELYPSGGGSVNQLIRIAVNHGERVGGFGASSPIPYGDYLVKINIDGMSGGAPIETLQVQYAIKVYTASWEFGYYDNGWHVIPLTDALGGTGPEIDGRYHTVYFRNTGNTPLGFCHLYDSYSTNLPDISAFTTVPVSGEINLLTPIYSNTSIFIKTNNTVFDSVHWPGIPNTDYIQLEYYNNYG